MSMTPSQELAFLQSQVEIANTLLASPISADRQAFQRQRITDAQIRMAEIRGSTVVPRSSPAPTSIESLDEVTSPFLRSQVEAFLAPLGLEDLTQWAVGLFSGGEFSRSQLEIELEDQPAFRQRFPAIFERRQKNLPPLSVPEILAYERQVSELASFWGIPENVIDPQQTLADDKSYNELQTIIADVVSFQNGDPQAMAELTTHIGVTRGELIGWALDRDASLPQIQTRLEAARISAQANRGGFGSLTAEEAQTLVRRGVDVDTARRAFAILGGELGDVIPGEVSDFGREQQLAAVAGEGEALSALERVRRRRLGVFEQGGGFAGGVEGIGTAQ